MVSRKQTRIFDPEKAIEVPTARGQSVQVQRVQEAGRNEVLLYCYSPARAEKDRAIDTKKANSRKPRMLVTVALANKMARIVWALLAKGEVYKAPVAATA